MPLIFEIFDKTRRKLRLTMERWKHIAQEHPNIENIDEIKEALISPTRIKPSHYDSEEVSYYYRYNKEKRRYLMIAVKYLNGDGFIITAYYTRNIK